MNTYDTNPWIDAKSYAPDCGELLAESWAIAASRHRAGQAPPRAVFHRLGHTVPIAIAVITALYFGGQLLRGVL